MAAPLRILLNALTLTLMYETVMIIYFLLDGVQINFNHILRLVQTIFYTGLCCIVMFPARTFLGMYQFNRRSKKKDKGIGELVITSERKLQELSLAPDLPNVAAVPVTMYAEPSVENQGSDDDISDTDKQKAIPVLKEAEE